LRQFQVSSVYKVYSPSQLPNEFILKKAFLAKPEFGKTTASSVIIGDLQNACNPNSQSGPRITAFFHFASGQPDKMDSYGAFRAILHQLIHAHRMELSLIDAISLLIESSVAGRLTASDDDIIEALQFCLRQYPGTILVFDGVDECQRSNDFIEDLFRICSGSETYITLLSRPNFEIQPTCRVSKTELLLGSHHNFTDIQKYLTDAVNDLYQNVPMVHRSSKEAVVEMLSKTSNGMFLWARLMIQYLNSRALTAYERYEAITSTRLVDGLDDIYLRILQLIENRRNVRERNRACEIFNIVMVASRPLGINELKHMLAFCRGRKISKWDILQDLQDSIGVLCEALVEMHEDETVHFIHNSVREFLSSDIVAARFPRYFVEYELAHARIAIKCLSYLQENVPPGPLSGSSVLQSHPAALSISLPLLEYSFFWTFHTKNSLRRLSLNDPVQGFKELAELLWSFLGNKRAITVWIEALWTYGKGDGLASLLNTASRYIQGIEDSIVPQLISSIGQLHTDLQELRKSWDFLLSIRPHAIWGPSITAYSRSSFWYCTDETTVTILQTENSLDQTTPLSIAQNLSTDASCLGSMYILPSV
jgi:hypothetical protein